MRRLALLLSIIGVACALVASTEAANRPTRFTFAFDQTFQSGFLSSACGFPVFVHLKGTAAAIAFYDKNGTVVRETDTSPNLMVTFFAPSTGGSFTYPLAGALIQEYINGTAVGSHAIATLTGIQDGTGSTGPDAGRVVFDAVIIDTSPEGLPVVDFVDVISVSGHFNEDVTAARCATLSGS